MREFRNHFLRTIWISELMPLEKVYTKSGDTKTFLEICCSLAGIENLAWEKLTIGKKKCFKHYYSESHFLFYQQQIVI